MDRSFQLLEEYAKDRDQAIVKVIRTGKLEAFKDFVKKWNKKGVYPSCFALPSDEVLEICVRQMCLHCTEIPPEVKGQAVNWLVDHNYHLDMTEERGVL